MISTSVLRTWWSKVRLRPKRKPLLSLCDRLGLTQASGNGETIVRLAWEEITVVYAYKRDCLTTDQIRLIIGNDESKLWIEVSEDEACYGELVAALPIRLPGCPPIDSWFSAVALPPFKTQWTALYKRESQN